jgi:8-oxo-dGTP diphosphatase
MKEYIFCPVCGTTLQIGMIEGKERKYCPKCDFVDYKNPLPVALAIAVKGKNFLLIKRGLPPRKGIWAPPSGFIETGETAEEACLRELKEETGVSGEILKLVGVVRREDKEVYGDMLVVEFLVKVGNEELKPESDVEDVRFFSVAELPHYYVERFSDIVKEIQKQG